MARKILWCITRALCESAPPALVSQRKRQSGDSWGKRLSTPYWLKSKKIKIILIIVFLFGRYRHILVLY